MLLEPKWAVIGCCLGWHLSNPPYQCQLVLIVWCVNWTIQNQSNCFNREWLVHNWNVCVGQTFQFHHVHLILGMITMVIDEESDNWTMCPNPCIATSISSIQKLEAQSNDMLLAACSLFWRLVMSLIFVNPKSVTWLWMFFTSNSTCPCLTPHMPPLMHLCICVCLLNLVAHCMFCKLKFGRMEAGEVRLQLRFKMMFLGTDCCFFFLFVAACVCQWQCCLNLTGVCWIQTCGAQNCYNFCIVSGKMNVFQSVHGCIFSGTSKWC